MLWFLAYVRLFLNCGFSILSSSGCLTEKSTTKSDTDGLDLCIVGQSVLAELATKTGLLEATEGHLVAEHVVVVDPDGTGLERVGHTKGRVEILGVNGSGKTIGGLVTSLDNLIFGLELADGADRSEDLLLHNLHIWADIGEDGGLNEVALVTVTLTTMLDLGASLLAGLDVAHNAVELKLADLRALEGVLLEWVTDNVLGCSGPECLNELVVDAGLDVDSGASTAALAVVEEDTEVDPRDRVLNVGIVENNVGRLAAELKGDLLQVGLGCGLEDGSANDGRASEGDLVDVHVRGNGCTSSLTKSRDDVDDTSGDTSLLAEGGGKQTGQRRLLSSLQDDSVASGQSRSDLPCPHKQREVPRNNLTANTNWLVSCVVEGLWVGVDGLSVDLVCPSTIISEAAGGQLDVDLGHRKSLAVIERLDGSEGVGVFVEEVTELGQHLTSGRGERLAPDAIEGFPGGLDGDVDICSSISNCSMRQMRRTYPLGQLRGQRRWASRWWG